MEYIFIVYILHIFLFRSPHDLNELLVKPDEEVPPIVKRHKRHMIQDAASHIVAGEPHRREEAECYLFHLHQQGQAGSARACLPARSGWHPPGVPTGFADACKSSWFLQHVGVRISCYGTVCSEEQVDGNTSACRELTHIYIPTLLGRIPLMPPVPKNEN